jgi:hypothetical protein
LWLGVVLVLASVLAGAALFSSADDTVAVWAVDSDLRAGMPLTSEDLHVVRVHFADAGSADSYLLSSHTLPGDATVTRDLAAGELLAVGAVRGSAPQPDQLPLAVAAAGQPAGLSVGDTVDVWSVPSTGAGGPDHGGSRQVLDDVVVTALGERAPGGLDSAREVLVALPSDADVADVLDGLRGADVVLVRVGG